MSESKIQIKIGNIEFSGEGNQDWLSKQLDKILQKISDSSLVQIEAPNANVLQSAEIKENSNKKFNLSIVNIASKLTSKSGPDLIITASAYLHFVENKPTFLRKDLLHCMQSATGYYKSNYSSAMTRDLIALVKKGALNQGVSQAYSLSVNKEKELLALLK
jgi:hypothetical protein